MDVVEKRYRMALRKFASFMKTGVTQSYCM